MAANEGRVYAGIGGWTYAPWRGVFYPKGLAHSKELTYAASHLTSIEVNGTFYRTMKPAVFRKWASEAPDGFVFSLKGPRYAVGRRVLAEAGDSIKRFLDSGISELGSKLGPLLWQFAPTKKFDDADFGKFLELLPKSHEGLRPEYILDAGNQQVMLCERGIRTFEAHTRFTLPLATVPYLQAKTHLPIVVDPSHGTGHTPLVPAMARAAIAAGADGLIMEVHPNPERALSDGYQSLTPAQFAETMVSCRRIAVAMEMKM
jgi:uncharacterized protein YecE (DUF72 family)